MVRWLARIAGGSEELVDAIRRDLVGTRSAHQVTELIAKVGKEIGGNEAEDTRP